MSRFVSILKTLPGAQALRRMRYTRFFKNAKNLNLFLGVYPSFEVASAQAPKNKLQGYDHDSPAALYDEYMEKLAPFDFPALFWLERLQGDVKTVFDFGGHVGIKYYAYSRYLSSKEQLKWTTYDLPAVVSRGKALAKKKAAHALSLTDELDQLKEGYDLLFASGSLQYLETPVEKIFGELEKKPRYVLINMLPLNDQEDVVTLQNIGPAYCPYKIFGRRRFLQNLEKAGYRLVDEWKNPDKHCIIPFHDDKSVHSYTGMLFQRA